MPKKTIYIVDAIHFWKDLKVQNPFMPMQNHIDPLPNYGVGFAPFFDSLEELRKHYPNSEYTTARFEEQ